MAYDYDYERNRRRRGNYNDYENDPSSRYSEYNDDPYYRGSGRGSDEQYSSNYGRSNYNDPYYRGYGSRSGYENSEYDPSRNRYYENYRNESSYGRQGYGRDYNQSYGGNRGYQGNYNERYERRDDRRDDRGLFERAGDEVKSWFGDEEAERRRNMDRMREGNFTGRGPRGYRRSDERIREDINDRMTYDPNLDASEIEVKVESGEVTLSGTVDSRWEKRRAEDIAESVSGVTGVNNQLRVNSSWTNQNQNQNQNQTETLGTTTRGRTATT